MTTKTDKEKFEDLTVRLIQYFKDYGELMNKIREFSKNAVEFYINKNFKIKNNELVLKKNSQISKEMQIIINEGYKSGHIQYDKEHKKFIINEEW